MLPGKALSLISSFLSSTPPPSPPSSTPVGLVERSEQRTVCVIFSKDRPGQLLCCLTSINDYVQGLDAIHVIFRSSNAEVNRKYCETFSRCRPFLRKLTAIDESTVSQSFQSLVIEAVRNYDFVLFQVDDALYYRKWIVKPNAIGILQSRREVLAVHSKLWSRAVRCQPAQDAAMRVPPLTPVAENHLAFSRVEGTFDWNYGFDLSGGLYRYADVKAILEAAGQFTNPNTLELSANAHALAQTGLAITRPMSACTAASTPCCSLVTINRVQEQFNNPVYSNSTYSAMEPWNELTDAIFRAGGMDLEAYRNASVKYDSVHVGDVFLRSCDPRENQIDVSVLLPCRNCEQSIGAIINSILSDTHGDLKMELIVIDDASTDASAFVIQRFTVIDARVRLLLRQRNLGGVAACLDFGLEHCRGRFIIRMDADDEYVSGRIIAQVREMEKRPRLGVLGMLSFVQYSGHKKLSSCTPAGPASVHWSMFFYCALLHPSVCIRKRMLDELGLSYVPAGRVARQEDYQLWHSILECRLWEIDNLPIVGLVHNKHVKSVTAQWDSFDRDQESSEIAWVNILNRVGPTNLTFTEWLVVCHPKYASRASLSPESKFEILRVLQRLKHSITADYQLTSTHDDLAFVNSDYEARVLELNALFG